jgi:uncharacterized protein YegP (UPF0339 family)
MIHLIKKNGKYHVVDAAPNHEVIKSSQSRGLTTRKAAIKNIRATARLYDAKIGFQLAVQDDTGDQPRMILVTEDHVYPSQDKPGRKYVPGKMKSPGSKAVAKPVTQVRSSAAPKVAVTPQKSAPKKATSKKAAPKKVSRK